MVAKENKDGVKRLSSAGQDQKEHIVALVALVAALCVSPCFS
jgi:hypothetical protein